MELPLQREGNRQTALNENIYDARIGEANAWDDTPLS